jgi:hypothetical protein
MTTAINDELICQMKQIIDRGDELETLIVYYEELISIYDIDTLDFPYMFRHVYVHACLKKRQGIITWLTELYETMDPIMKIGLRQIFAYGKYLLQRGSTI